MTISARSVFAILFSVATIIPTVAAGAVDTVLYVPAASFSSDGLNQDLYSNWGQYLDTNATKTFHASIKLPNTATITNVDIMTLDSDVGTITGYLQRTKFG